MEFVKLSTNACCVYDFTAFLGEDERPIIENLKKYCKKWCFQLETTKDGKLHFQGRLNLKVKERLGKNLYDKFPGFHLSITSSENRGNEFYVTKEDSRVKGPWSDRDEEVYIPRDIREIESLLPWQATLLDLCKVYNPRKIDVVYNPGGNIGKTIFTRYMMCYKLGQIVPFCNDFKDIMRMVMDMPTSSCYFIDMPKAINKEKLYQLYAGIEMVKSGYAYDDRYHFKQKLFDPPNIVIFTNTDPDRSLLSMDRWRVWHVVNNELKPYNEPRYEDIAGI